MYCVRSSGHSFSKRQVQSRVEVRMHSFTGGSAMTAATLAKTDPKFVKQFHLNSLSTALKPPKVWLEEHLDNRNAYLKAYQQVKSA